MKVPTIALTPEQTALTPIYREKWRQIGLSIAPLDRPIATAAINTAYNIIGLGEPEIIFCDSPYIALEALERLRIRDSGLETGSEIRDKIHNELYDTLRSQLNRKLENEIYSQLYNPLYAQLIGQFQIHVKDEVYAKLAKKLGSRFHQFFVNITYNNNWILSELSACHGSWVDFCIEVLGLECDRSLYSAFKALVENCGWIYPFEKKCFVCDRPRRINFDSEYLLHALCQPAIEFADNFRVYSYRGVLLPESIGQVAPESWEASWLLREKNAEVRRVLIGAIGYPKICQELQAIELDTWQEYTLLKIENDVDIEPIFLLKMTCPSTGHIHALRVPPKVLTAKEAISWVNWGIAPEEFQVQT
ncbi:MAG: hypothetical protein JGK35_29155 [Microcoleus sp. PH2017_16_JOR_D_A]|uniref:DUF6745 domain-containing protein n=1 Tax=Microcoleus sp. PH2017_16_JOR_D_A TaxID=2798827 RepID=UPI001DE0FD42|nr:hypothetical protein [Microcoleus sp. PH2017_16_JOR_D_A]MCC3494509.1 hypothetical protein [Microcoleus sp. PH2017_16_JOR_D_A]